MSSFLPDGWTFSVEYARGDELAWLRVSGLDADGWPASNAASFVPLEKYRPVLTGCAISLADWAFAASRAVGLPSDLDAPGGTR